MEQKSKLLLVHFEKLTKIKLNLNKKTEIESKTTSKNTETKNIFVKKSKNRLVLFVKGLGKSQIDWIVCRIYKVCGYEDFKLGIYGSTHPDMFC